MKMDTWVEEGSSVCALIEDKSLAEGARSPYGKYYECFSHGENP